MNEERSVMNERTRKGFSLVEMLVVIGIIAVLVAASLGGYSAVTKSAERTKCREIVTQAAIALMTLYQNEGTWPRRLATEGKTDGRLDAECARQLVAGENVDMYGKKTLTSYYALRLDDDGKPTGYDRFGIVTPWAADVLRRAGRDANLQTVVSTSRHGPKTVEDHLLHFAVDLDGDGIIEGAMVGGESVTVRATAIVWCAGKDGHMEPYSRGLREDDVYSWSPGQAKMVK